MKNVRYILPALLIILFAGCAATPSATAPEGHIQTGSWVVREDQVTRVAAGGEGQGTLIFRGWQHAFKFTDARIIMTGTRTGDIEGEIYNLETLSDVEGTYYVRPEFNEAKKVTGFWLHNDKGVTLHMRVQGENIDVNLEAQGVTITLIE